MNKTFILLFLFPSTPSLTSITATHVKKSVKLLFFKSSCSHNMNYENGFNFHNKSYRYGVRIMWFIIIIIIIILTFFFVRLILTLNYVAIYQVNGRESWEWSEHNKIIEIYVAKVLISPNNQNNHNRNVLAKLKISTAINLHTRGASIFNELYVWLWKLWKVQHDKKKATPSYKSLGSLRKLFWCHKSWKHSKLINYISH